MNIEINNLSEKSLAELDSFLLSSKKELAQEKELLEQEMLMQALGAQFQERLILLDDLIKQARTLSSSSLEGLLELRKSLTQEQNPLVLETKPLPVPDERVQARVEEELGRLLESIKEIGTSSDPERMVHLRACLCDWRSLVREYIEEFGKVPTGSKEVGLTLFKTRDEQVLGSLFNMDYDFSADEWIRLGDLFSRLVPALQAMTWLENNPDVLHISDLQELLNCMGAISSQFHREFKKVQDGYKNQLYKFLYDLANKKQIYLGALDLDTDEMIIEEWSSNIWNIVELKTKVFQTKDTTVYEENKSSVKNQISSGSPGNVKRDSKGRFLAKQKTEVRNLDKVDSESQALKKLIYF